MSRADRNRLLRELAELLRARSVDAVFHSLDRDQQGDEERVQ